MGAVSCKLVVGTAADRAAATCLFENVFVFLFAHVYRKRGEGLAFTTFRPPTKGLFPEGSSPFLGSSRKVRETNREEPNEHKEETVISVAISKALGNFNLVIESLKFTC